MLIDCPLRQRTLATPSAPAIRQDERSLNAGELNELVDQYCAGLLQHDVAPGDHVAILSRNSIDYVALLLAIMRIHAVAVPLNIRLSATELGRQISKLESSLLVVDFVSREVGADIPCQLASFDSLSESRDGGSNIGEHEPLDTDQVFSVCFTSGSDGNPKGVVLTLGNLYYNALGSNENIVLTPEDTWRLSLPLFHVGGLGIMFRSLLSGARICVSPAFDPRVLNRQIDRGDVTHLSLVPTMLLQLLESRNYAPFPKSVKAVLVSGAPISAQLQERIDNLAIPIVRSYGLTEMASQITATPAGKNTEQFATSGRPLRYRELKIDPIPDRADGEICVRGAVLFKGYLGNPENPVDADGWFHTGDIGSMNQNGNLTVLGRKDEMFISGGENIFPQEIADVAEQIAGIVAAAVVPVPDATWGSRPIMFVKFADGFKVDQERILHEMAKSLARYKLPDRIIVLDNIPQTALGKTDKQALIEIAQRG
ncbi:MAG: o-succinylbenzoate--CoA ligase [Candidatus Zixiibacteriota bacterium]